MTRKMHESNGKMFIFSWIREGFGHPVARDCKRADIDREPETLHCLKCGTNRSRDRPCQREQMELASTPEIHAVARRETRSHR